MLSSDDHQSFESTKEMRMKCLAHGHNVIVLLRMEHEITIDGKNEVLVNVQPLLAKRSLKRYFIHGMKTWHKIYTLRQLIILIKCTGIIFYILNEYFSFAKATFPKNNCSDGFVPR